MNKQQPPRPTFEDRLDAAGLIRVCTEREAQAFQRSWQQVFSRNLHAATGAWSLLKYEWHVFSYNHARHITGTAAAEAYAEQPPEKEYVVLASNLRCPGEAYVVRGRPELGAVARDFSVFPHSLAWTMAFTHEDGWIGPFFARAEWQASPAAAQPTKTRRVKR